MLIKKQVELLISLGYKLCLIPANETKSDSVEIIETFKGDDYVKNLAVKLGEQNDGKMIFCVEFSGKYGGMSTLNRMQKEHGGMPKTPHCDNLSGGVDYYFRGSVENEKFERIGVSVHALGPRVIPNSCVGGVTLEWKRGFELYDCVVEEPPRWLFEALYESKIPLTSFVPSEKKEEEEAPEMPIPWGIMGELYELILATSFNKIPAFALAACKTIVGAVLQRTIVPPRGGCLSTYSVILGPASCGKGHYLSCVTTTLNLVDSRILMDKVSTAQSLKKSISEYPSRCAVLDEINERFDGVHGKSSNSMTKMYHNEILELWGAPKLLPGIKTKKDDGCIGPQKNPRYSEMIAGVLDRMLLQMQNPAVMQDGYTARADFYPHYTSNLPELEILPDFEPSESLIQRLRDLQGKNLMSMSTPFAEAVPELDKVRMTFDEPSWLIFLQYRQELWDKQHSPEYAQRAGVSDFFGRCLEKTERTASKIAACDGSHTIMVQHMNFAIQDQKCLIYDFLKMIDNMPVSELDSLRKEIIKLTSISGTLTMSELARTSLLFRRASFKLQNDAITSLERDSFVTIEKFKNGGQKLIIVR